MMSLIGFNKSYLNKKFNALNVIGVNCRLSAVDF